MITDVRTQRLDEIRDLLLTLEANDVVPEVLELIESLKALEAPRSQLQVLVEEAYDLFTNPDSRINLRDWTQAAQKVIGPR